MIEYKSDDSSEITFEEYLENMKKYEANQRNSEEYNLYKPFDIEKHKAKYTHYLEVVIDVDGVIHYGVPSHEMKAIELYLKRTGRENTQENQWKLQDEIFDSQYGIESVTGCILVWENVMSYFKINAKQLISLRKLKTSGLVTFPIPSIDQLKESGCWESSKNE